MNLRAVTVTVVLLVAPLLLALTWTTPSPPAGDDRVRLAVATAGILRAECYAFEPYEDRLYYDIVATGVLGASVKIVSMRGVWTTIERCKYEAHYDLVRKSKTAYDAASNPPPKCPTGQTC